MRHYNIIIQSVAVNYIKTNIRNTSNNINVVRRSRETVVHIGSFFFLNFFFHFPIVSLCSASGDRDTNPMASYTVKKHNRCTTTCVCVCVFSAIPPTHSCYKIYFDRGDGSSRTGEAFRKHKIATNNNIVI